MRAIQARLVGKGIRSSTTLRSSITGSATITMETEKVRTDRSI